MTDEHRTRTASAGHGTEIRAIERIAAATLPCLQRVHDDGWQLRYNDGLTRRCMSVLPLEDGIDPVDAKLQRAEDFYRRRSAVSRFQVTTVSRPLGLTSRLADRGYHRSPGAVVMTAAVSEMVAPPARGSVTLEVGSAPSDDWLDELVTAGAVTREKRAALAATLACSPQPAAFMRLMLDGEPAVVGLAVVVEEMVGVFNVATLPGQRRRGAAGALMEAMGRWGLERGGRLAYLQVHPANQIARAVYRRYGFTDHHWYDYWQLSSG